MLVSYTDPTTKKLTWKEFSELPIVGISEHRDKIRRVEHSGELVAFAKGISELVCMLRIGGAKTKVDFQGCSSSYVVEKVRLAIRDLKWIEYRIKEMEKSGETK